MLGQMGETITTLSPHSHTICSAVTTPSMAAPGMVMRSMGISAPIVRLWKALIGLYGWALVIATGTGHDGAIGPHFNALGADWVIFLAAAQAVFSHDLSHIYDQAWITSATNNQFAYWLSSPLPFPLFPYPPL